MDDGDQVSQQLDAICRSIVAMSDRDVFHMVGCNTIHTGIKEVITVSFDQELTVPRSGDAKENTQYIDTHAACASLIRGILEADIQQSQVAAL